MVDSLPPSGTSGTDPDNKTIMTNSNGKLSVPLDRWTLDVGSSGKVEVFETRPYLGNFAQDSGDWTGIDSVEDGIATVNVPTESTASASVTADLTGIDVLTFRIDVYQIQVKIKFDGITEGQMDSSDGYRTLEISGLDHYGPNTTVEIVAYDGWNGDYGAFYIDYIRGNPIQTESRKMELCDAGGL